MAALSQCPGTTGGFEITLDTVAGEASWNMLSNAFEFDVTPDQMRIATKSGSVCAHGCTLGEAKEMDIFHNQFWHSNGLSAYTQLEGGQAVKRLSLGMVCGLPRLIKPMA